MSKILKDKGLTVSSFSNKAPCCPFCNTVSKKDLKEEKAYHFVCPKCKRHFVVDNSSHDMAAENTENIENKEVEYVFPTQVKYVYVGVNYGTTEGIPLKERLLLFFKARKEAWRSFVILSRK